MENTTDECVWVIKNKMEEMKWNIDIAVHSLRHFVEEYYYIIQQHIDQISTHITIWVLDIRHEVAEWVDPYPRCTYYFQ